MHVAQNWRINGQRYALKGVQCPSCGKAHFQPRSLCSECQQQEKTATIKPMAEVATESIMWQRAAR